jgi:hypothetical protein
LENTFPRVEKIRFFFKIIDQQFKFCIIIDEASKISIKSVLVVFLRCKARIGKEDFIKGIAGRYTLHKETRKNGSMLGRFASMYNMTTESTCFDHKNIYKRVWKALWRCNQSDGPYSYIE